MRDLTISEITQMERQGCRCADWSLIKVDDGFDAQRINNVRMEGEIHIGEGVSIDNVSMLRTTDGATFGQNNLVSVKNEAGSGGIVVYDKLSSQMAAFMMQAENDKQLTARLRNMVAEHVEQNVKSCTTIGRNVTISDCRELTNVIVGEGSELAGASRLIDCTLVSTHDASVYIGDDVIMDNVVVQPGASVVDGARLYDSFVGEATHIGRGFTSEASVFFANSHMDNGEACAALCGPFSVSHHKASLLIGGEYSFYNAGSATNFSNHAYKMGPIHYGTLERGSKTASGSHILWPAHIGAFSMVMGKVQSHPDTSALPFSYVIAEGRKTYVVPGRNLLTVGTYRDVTKWPKRDKRPQEGRLSLITYDWLSPYVVQRIKEARSLLQQMLAEQGEEAEEYQGKGYTIKASALHKGLEYYKMALTMYSGAASNTEWVDMLGLLAPADALSQIKEDMAAGDILTIQQLEDRFMDIYSSYEQWRGSSENESANMQAHERWLEAVRHDAEREFELGDVSEETIAEFMESLH